MSDNVTITGIDVLKPGTYTDANGTKVEVTADMIAEMAAEFAPDLQDAPAVVGHPKMDDPAYGWLRNFRVGEDAVLFCDAVDVDPEFAETLRKGRFKRKSLSFYLPKTRGNPKPGKCYPKHLGLLGARAPAVSGLKPISFAADDDAVVIELAAPGWSWRIPWAFRSMAGALQRLREHTIEKESVEAADKLIPAYTVEDLQSAAADIEAANRAAEEASPHFASPTDQNEEVSMATAQDLAAREADLAKRQADLDSREKGLNEKAVALSTAESEARKSNDIAFVDNLIKDGRLAPTEKDDVLAELAGLDDGEPTIALAAGDDGKPAKLTPHQAYRNRLAKAPKLVALGEHDKGGKDLGTVEFAAPDGYSVSPGSLDIHSKTIAVQRANPGMDYAAALAQALN